MPKLFKANRRHVGAQSVAGSIASRLLSYAHGYFGCLSQPLNSKWMLCLYSSLLARLTRRKCPFLSCQDDALSRLLAVRLVANPATPRRTFTHSSRPRSLWIFTFYAISSFAFMLV